jgi:adenylate cyclase
MAKEIERKFLVHPDRLPALSDGITIQQGYLPLQGKTVVRARLKGNKAFLTLKGANNGISRSEFEYQIPVDDARQIITELCSGPCIEKTRYEIKIGKHLWEIDVFAGDNAGLIVAEVELNDEAEYVELPAWVAEEVTGQARYYNSNLLNKPFSQW